MGGDLTSSDSDNSTLDGAWGGDVDNEIEMLDQSESAWGDKESSESDGGWDLQAGMPLVSR